MCARGRRQVDSLMMRLVHVCLRMCLGKVRPLVDSVFDFVDVLKAYERLLTGRATGKVIVKVDPNVT
jgi:NADPH:quinone reductase-like Zn-dependent oxidoreductase